MFYFHPWPPSAEFPADLYSTLPLSHTNSSTTYHINISTPTLVHRGGCVAWRFVVIKYSETLVETNQFQSPVPLHWTLCTLVSTRSILCSGERFALCNLLSSHSTAGPDAGSLYVRRKIVFSLTCIPCRCCFQNIDLSSGAMIHPPLLHLRGELNTGNSRSFLFNMPRLVMWVLDD